MDTSRPYIFGSNELCYDVNPTLWNVFCALTNRLIGQPNYIWTEHDVITVMLARGLNRHDARKNDSDNEHAGSDQSGSGYDIRRDLSTGNVMAVRHLPNSEDSVVFIVSA